MHLMSSTCKRIFVQNILCVLNKFDGFGKILEALHPIRGASLDLRDTVALTSFEWVVHRPSASFSERVHERSFPGEHHKNRWIFLRSRLWRKRKVNKYNFVWGPPKTCIREPVRLALLFYSLYMSCALRISVFANETEFCSKVPLCNCERP